MTIVLICGCQADMYATLVQLKQECDYNDRVYEKLSLNAENSGMTKCLQNFSGINTIDKVSIWDGNCWILSCWLYYVTGLDIPTNHRAQVNLLSVNSLQ